jgi:hypothetical protein
MGFKMKSGNKVSFKNMGSSPAKQLEPTKRLEEKKEFKKIQHLEKIENPIHIRKSHTKKPSNKELLKMMEDMKSPKKKKSPAKQEGPIDEKQLKLQPSENPDTYVYKPGKRIKDKNFHRRERIGGLEDRVSFIDEAANAEGRSINEQEKKDKAKLKQELAILRKSKHK